MFPLTAPHRKLNLFLNELMLIWAMVMPFMFLSFIFLKCSKTVNLPFALESEVKLSVAPELQSSECDLSTLLRLLLIVAVSRKFLFTIWFFDFFKNSNYHLYYLQVMCY